jgi:hypothetical protein
MSILSHLSSHLYIVSKPPAPTIQITLISLLFYLVSNYPSQVMFREHIDCLPSSFLPRGTSGRRWITSLAFCLRSMNYARFEELTSLNTLLNCLPRCLGSFLTPPPSFSYPNGNLGMEAFQILLTSLRSKTREKTWNIVRSAYRELPCHVGSPARNWLMRTLCLHDAGSSDDLDEKLDRWMDEKGSTGHVKKKEGIEGQWIVCKF